MTRHRVASIRNGNGYTNARDGELRVRVDALDRDVSHIESSVSTIRDTMATKLDVDRISASIASIAALQTASSKTQWPVILSAFGLCLTFVVLIGGFAFIPVREAQSDMKQALTALSGHIVGRTQYDHDQAGLRDLIQKNWTFAEQSMHRIYEFNGRLGRLEETSRALEKIGDLRTRQNQRKERDE